MKTRKNNTIIKKNPDTGNIKEILDHTDPVENEDTISSPTRKHPKNMWYLPLVNQISLIRRSIDSSLSDPDMMRYLSKYGYNEAEFQVGLNMVNEVETLYVRQGDMQINRKNATRKKIELGKEAGKMLSRFMKTARLAFENDPEILLKLKSPGQLRQNFDVWLEMGKVFYATIFSLPEILEGFEKFRVSREELESGRQKLIEVETQSKTQFGIYADSQIATDEVYKAYSRLKKWWSEYRKISRIAFQQSPQMLEKLGITIPTRVIPTNF